jgi:ribose transport system substrate-binding protein
MRRRFTGPFALVLALAVSGAAGTGLLAARATAAPQQIAAATHPPPYKIALSNSYIGNTWRVEMVNEFKSACAMEPLKSIATCTEYSSGNDVSKQTAQIDDLISSHVDAIVLNAASPTGLNGVITQACNAGILVVSFDAVVTNPCALKVNTDQVAFGAKGAQFVVDQLHGKGNIIEVTGVAGTGVDQDRNKGADAVFAKYPDIKIVAKYSGQWASDVAQRATVQQLPSLGKIDGIWCQGGTDGVIRALIDAKRPFPIPIAGEAENAFRQYMITYKDKGFKALSIGQPPFLGIISLWLASEVLQGKHAKTDVTIPFPYVTQDTVKEGVTTFKDLPGSYFVDFTDSGPNATVVVCKDAVLHGTPCPGKLVVRLPSS